MSRIMRWVFLSITAAVAIAFASGLVSAQVAATPTFSQPYPGTYYSPQSAVLSDSSPGTTIYYTTDGTTPTTASTPYTGPIPISSTTTVKAIAGGGGYQTSSMVSGTFVIKAATPTFSQPYPATYTSPQSAVLSDSSPGATIYYTTDGTTPTTASTPYTGPIPVSSTTTIKAMAGGGGYADSSVVSGTFVINAPPPSISSISPNSGLVGTSITITGSNFGASQGTSTITLSGTATTPSGWSDTSVVAPVPSGAISGNVVVTVGGVASNGVFFTVILPPSITTVSPVSGSVGTPVTITGSYFGASQGTSTLTFNGTAAPPTGWSDTTIVAPVPSGAISGNVVVTVDGLNSNSVSFTVIPPDITSISPTSGPPGTQVTITGVGFGPTQGGGSVTLGNMPGVITSWSDTQIVATAASGASSGVVRVQQGGVWSNSVLFTVQNPRPVITSVSPNNGVPGTQVTVTGSGFGAQETGSIILGTTNGTVVSWSDTQIVAAVATGSTSGAVQVIQSGTISDPVAFTVNVPHLSGVSPVKGVAGTQVTVTGSGFGASQADSQVWLGSTYGAVVSWSNTQIVALVDATATSGVAKVLRGGVWSNSITFTVPPSGIIGPTGVTINPSLMNLLVGEERPVKAVDQNGLPVTGLTWASSDITIATLSSDDPPTLTAVAPGHVTITANDSSADVTVYAGAALPIGTIKWSNPGDGSGVSRIVPAVPSATGVADVFAVQASGALQAVTADGTAAWTVPAVGTRRFIPDFEGGVVYIDNTSLRSLDGVTGQPRSAYTFTTADGARFAKLAAHTDGTIFTTEPDKLIAIDPATGTVKFSAQLEHSTWDSEAGRQIDRIPRLDDLIVAGDGFAYLAYDYTTSTSNYTPGQSATAHNESFLKIVRMGTDGATATFTIGHWTDDYSYSIASRVVPYGSYYTDQANAAALLDTRLQNYPACAVDNNCSTTWPIGTSCQLSDGCISYGPVYTQSGYAPFNSSAQDPVGSVPVWYAWMITDADQGVLASVSVTEYGYHSRVDQLGSTDVPPHFEIVLAALSTAGGLAKSSIAMEASPPMLIPTLQLQDGYFVGKLGSYDDSSMVGFDRSGNFRWAVKGRFEPQVATADGGVIAVSYPPYSNTPATYLAFDQNGRATGQLASFPVQSWTGDAYVIGSVIQISTYPYFIGASFLAKAGTPYVPIDSVANKNVADLLTSAMWRNFGRSHCGSVFRDPRAFLGPNYSLDMVQKKQKMTNFYSIDNQDVGNLTLAAVTAGQLRSNVKLVDRIGQNTAITDNRGFDRQTAIILKRNFFSEQNAKFTLVHEILLHAYAAQSDDDVFQNEFFIANGLWRESGSTATSNITAWISTDCRCTPGKPGDTCEPNTATW